MATDPGSFLLMLLLGLVALLVLAAGLYLLSRAIRPPARVVVMRPTGHAATARPVAEALPARTPSQRRRAAWLVAASLLLMLAVFLGRFLVRPFYPARHERPDLSAGVGSTVEGASGARLSVLRFGSGDGPTLLFTHGWGADKRDWAYAISTLPPGTRVAVWDLPGLGSSSATHGGDYSVPTLARDLDSVVTSLGGGPVVLIGHSIGGMMNLEYARLFPQKLGREVRAIVQADTTYTNPVATKKGADTSLKLQKPVFEPLLRLISWASPVARGLGWFSYQSGLAHLQLASQSFAGAESWEQLDEMARYAYRSSPRVIAQGVLGMLHWDASDVLPTVKVPTLIISGDEDVTTLPSASDRMAHDIAGSERVSMSTAAHLGPVEQYRKYGEAINAFVVKTGAGSPSAGRPVAQADTPAR